MHIALVRQIHPKFHEALVRHAYPSPPDVQQARAQHAAYCVALAAAGCELVYLDDADKHVDGCFVEDQAVVHEGVALIARSGAPARRAEAGTVATALETLGLQVHRMSDPDRLDGGDVLRVGTHLWVGRSERTNGSGVRALRRAFEPAGFTVHEVSVRDALHLKCHCSRLTDEAVLLAEGFLDPSLFDGIAQVHLVPAHEAYAANVVPVGPNVLIARGYPRVHELVDDLGLNPVPLHMTHIARADGSLTCLSVIINKRQMYAKAT